MSFATSCVVVGVVGAVVLLVALEVARRPARRGLRVVLALLWLWAWVVVYQTFGTPSGGGQAVNLRPLDVSNGADRVDFALNMLMFVPLGILLASQGVRWFVAGAVALGASLTIEALQYLTASGRTSDVNDLVANTLGCVVGALVTVVCVRAAGTRRPR